MHKTTNNNSIDIDYKNINLLSLFKRHYVFLVFTLLNTLLPIVLCLLGAFQNNNGMEVALAIGLSTPFQLTFINIIFIFTFWIVLSIIKEYKNKVENNNIQIQKLFWIILFSNIVITIILTMLFLLSSWAYVQLFYGDTNADIISSIGLNFIYYFTGAIFFIGIGFVFNMLIHIQKGGATASILEGIRFILIILFSLVFQHTTNLKEDAIGLGVLIGSLVSLILNFSYYFIYFKIWKYKYIFEIYWLLFIIKGSWAFILIKTLSSLLKPMIFFVMGASKSTQDYNFMVSKNIWYFALYFVPFLSDSFSKIISYHAILNAGKYEKNEKNLHSLKKLFIFDFATLIIISIACYFLVQPISNIFILNHDSILNPPLPINIETIKEKVLLPSSVAMLFTLLYCLFNNVSETITDARELFVIEKKSRNITSIIMIVIVIGAILGIGYPLMTLNNPVGGLGAFTVPMLFLALIFFFLNLFNWFKFSKLNKKLN